MIDGIKIATKHRSNSDWLNDSLLSFRSIIDEKTGELQSTGTYAEYKGLFFSVYPYKDNNTFETCYIRGSLAKFYNNGLDNAFDFTFQQVKEALNHFKTLFKLDLNNCSLHGLEIGFNLMLPIPVKEFFQRIKQIKGSGLGVMYQNRKVVGRKVDFQRYTLKIYDKGKQQNTKEKHYVRFEIAVKKMEFLKSFGIESIQDIQDSNKVKKVALSLVEWVQNSIFYEKDIQYKAMTNFEQKKWLYFGNTSNWERYTRKQKSNAKIYFQRLINQYCIKSVKAEIVKRMIEKIDLLTANKLGQINQDFKNTSAEKLGQINPLDKELKRTHNSKNIKRGCRFKKGHKKRSKCKVCNKDISSKKNGAIYCSKQCNNKYNGMQRTQRNRKRINREKIGLSRINGLVPKQKLWLWITYTDKGIEYTDYLHQSEIRTTNEWINKVIKIRADNFRKGCTPIELHGFRARKIINKINQLNKKQNDKQTKKTNSLRYV